MFLVANSELVQPLTYSPVVYDDVGEKQDEWLQPAAKFFDDPSQYDVLRAAKGPASWPRYDVPADAKLTPTAARTEAEKRGEQYAPAALPDPPRVPLPAVQVSNIQQGDDSVQFDVDQVGVPVLVKVSYFPNWKVDGADGPYRVTPNLMVVVPKSTHVRLHYGYTGADYASYGATALGIVLLVLLFRFTPGAPSTPVWDPFGPRRRRSTEPLADVDEHLHRENDPVAFGSPVATWPPAVNGPPPNADRSPNDPAGGTTADR
jgi:hypothetical protein